MREDRDRTIIRVAKVELNMEQNDCRLTLRLLPEMENLDSKYLPRWPWFFGQRFINCKQGELVWVITNPEYSMGFVMGMANSYTWGGSYVEPSIKKTVFDTLANVQLELKGKLLNFGDIEVTFFNEKSAHFIERPTGGHVIVFSDGTIQIVRPKEIFMKVGKSVLKMTNEEIHLTADTVRIGGKVRLGNNPKGKVFVHNGVGGKNAGPTEDVWA